MKILNEGLVDSIGVGGVDEVGGVRTELLFQLDVNKITLYQIKHVKIKWSLSLGGINVKKWYQ